MSKTATLAIGSCYIDFEVGDMPIEASGIPVDVELVGGDYYVEAGGSAVNFCKLLKQLGSNTTFVGLVGEDYYAQIFENLLKEAGVKPALVYKPDVSTNVSFNLTSKNGQHHDMFVAGTANAALDADSVLPKLRSEAPFSQVLYVGGLFKLKRLQPVFGEIAGIAAENGTMLVVDHGRVRGDIPEDMRSAVRDFVIRATYYLPSRDEFCALWNVETIEEGLALLYNRAPYLTVVVKDGPNGAYYHMGNTSQHIPAKQVTSIKSLTGAGDSFNAGFIAAINHELQVEKAIEFACTVAAAKISGQHVPKLSA
jgi:sugar/nucleoside kinase (ribokinase family)